MFTDSWIYRGFMRYDLWTKQHFGQGVDRCKMHSFEFGHLRGDYLGLNIILRSFFYATLNFDKRSHYSLSACRICGYTCKNPIIAHIALEQGTWCWLLTAARFIALSLISRYHSLDPNNRDISRVHCISTALAMKILQSCTKLSIFSNIHFALGVPNHLVLPDDFIKNGRQDSQ